MRCESSCSVVSSLRRFCASRLVTLIFVEGESDGRLKHLHEMYFLNSVYNYILTPILLQVWVAKDVTLDGAVKLCCQQVLITDVYGRPCLPIVYGTTARWIHSGSANILNAPQFEFCINFRLVEMDKKKRFYGVAPTSADELCKNLELHC